MSINAVPQSSHHITHARSDPARAVHFVGSLPPELLGDDRATMQWLLDHTVGTEITALPCDRDPRWIVTWLEDLADVPALETVRTGASTCYDDTPTYRLKRGQWLEPDDVSLHRFSQTTAAMAARDQVCTEQAVLPPHQVSVPNPFDLALFAFGGPAGSMAHLPVFRHAVLDDLRAIHDRWGNQAVFQLETPAVLASMDRTPRPLWPAAAHTLAKHTAAVIADGPHSARWTIHLCHGDLGHTPLFTPNDLVPAVQFLNALHKRLQRLRLPMPAAHIPMCTGTTAPPTDPRFYRALRHLRRDIDVIAGLVDETHPDDARTALRLSETELDRPVLAVAASCGHGRRTVPATSANTALACELAHLHTDITTP